MKTVFVQIEEQEWKGETTMVSFEEMRSELRAHDWILLGTWGDWKLIVQTNAAEHLKGVNPSLRWTSPVEGDVVFVIRDIRNKNIQRVVLE